MKSTIAVSLAMSCLTLLLSATGVGAGDITLSAAASLKESLTEIAGRFVIDHPGVTIRKNFGASGSLAKQIENGAPVDIFIAADQKWVSYLSQKRLLDSGSTAVLAANTLVFVGRDTVHLTSLSEVATLERVAIGSPKSVPAGDYAMQALQQAGIAKALEAKLVMAKDVRECLMYAERGEVDGAFVYRTDALLAQKARILFTVAPGLHSRITYPMGLTSTGAKNEDAKQFLQYLQSAEARELLRQYGFTLP